MLLAGAAVAAATWQRAGIVELHEPGDGGSAGLFGAAHGAELGGIFWYWPSADEAPKGGIGRYFLVLACPGWGPEGAVLGGIFWYWPSSAGLDVLSAFFWDFVNLRVVLAFFLRGKGGRREPGGGGGLES